MVKQTGNVLNSVEIQLAKFSFTTGRVDSDRQGAKDTKKWHIWHTILGALIFLGVLGGKIFVSTEKDTVPADELD